ncbi:MAG: hypothetical protein QNJ22_06305 [Desulfosarcinaceae bacterium]|nr:hypothetical protein [Desulfosarcinaceae bacterium]
MFPFFPVNIAQITLLIGVFVMVHMIHRFSYNYLYRRPARPEDYLFKTARLFGRSEYEVFQKAAEAWPVSDAEIEADFKRYLTEQHIPCYVNAFVRQHKDQLDRLHLPPW